ncbi:MAG: Ig-like domain-containing protein [Patescibacteria group bacterium]
MHRSRRRIYRSFFMIGLAVAITLPSVVGVFSGTQADALVGDYEWSKATDGTGIAGDKIMWLSLASSSDGTRLAAVGKDDGYQSVYLSSDSGTTWNQTTINEGQRWNDVALSSDGTKIVATATGGYIYTSSDSGATWIERTAAGSRQWGAIASNADGTKLVAGVGIFSGPGSIYTSTDSGATWTERTSAGSRVWVDIASSADGTKLSAIPYAFNEYVYTSTDSGATWTQRTTAGARTWSSITSSADGTKLAASHGGKVIGNGSYGANGYIYTSTDSGATWTQRTASGVRQWSSLAFNDDGTKLVASVRSGYIYTSTDSGATWTQRTSIGSQGWLAVASSADGLKLAAATEEWSSNGAIYTSTNYGATWAEHTVEGVQSWGSSAMSADGTKRVASNYSGSIYTSTNSGITWTERISDESYDWVSVASSADGVKLLAADYDGYIYTSSDSGITWTERTSSGIKHWSMAVSNTDGAKLVALDFNGYIYTSTNAGITWTEQTSSGIKQWASAAISADGSVIIASSYTDGLWHSTNSGSTWTKINIGAAESTWYDVAISSDAKTLVAVDADEGPDVDGGYVYVSHDAGQTWTAASGLGRQEWKDFGGNGATVSADGKRIAIVDADGVTSNNWNGGFIYTSLDGGITWVENRAPQGGEWTSIAMSADGAQITATSDWYNAGIHTAVLTQPTLEFTPSENPADDPIVPTSTNPAAPQTITQTQPTFTGVTYPNSPVTVTVHSDPITCSTVSDAQGNWSCTLPASIPPGNHTVIIELTNSANNQTELIGPFYVQVLGATTVTSTTPLAPNTGIRPKLKAPYLI